MCQTEAAVSSCAVNNICNFTSSTVRAAAHTAPYTFVWPVLDGFNVRACWTPTSIPSWTGASDAESPEQTFAVLPSLISPDYCPDAASSDVHRSASPLLAGVQQFRGQRLHDGQDARPGRHPPLPDAQIRLHPPCANQASRLPMSISSSEPCWQRRGGCFEPATHTSAAM